MYFSKSLYVYLHSTSTCEHGKCSFWNLTQSHNNSSKRSANLLGGRLSLGFCVSYIKNLVLLLSKESTLWVFTLDCASSNAFSATSMFWNCLFALSPSYSSWLLKILWTTTLSLGMVKSPLLHRGSLRGNGHQFLYIKAFCEAMVIDCFVTSRPSPINCHWFSYVYIEALCEAMIIDFFISRPFV